MWELFPHKIVFFLEDIPYFKLVRYTQYKYLSTMQLAIIFLEKDSSERLMLGIFFLHQVLGFLRVLFYRYLAWRNARTVSNFFYTSHMVYDYFDTLMQDLNKVLLASKSNAL